DALCSGAHAEVGILASRHRASAKADIGRHHGAAQAKRHRPALRRRARRDGRKVMLSYGKKKTLVRGVGCGRCVPRRDVLAGFAAVAASAFTPAAPALAQPAIKPTRIDVHRHFVPPGYQVDATRQHLNDRSTIARQLEDMDKGGVALAVTTVIVPDLKMQEEPAARSYARLANEFAAKLRSDYPGRFGSFAYLPFPHIDATLKEIEYAYD